MKTVKSQIFLVVLFFSNMSPQVGETKGKINKWDHIKLKSLHSKGNQPNEKTTH